MPQDSWARKLQLLKPTCSVAHTLQLEKAVGSNKDPVQPKIDTFFKNFKRGFYAQEPPGAE